MKRVLLTISSALLIAAAPAANSTFVRDQVFADFTNAPLIEIIGSIDREMLPLATQIDELSDNNEAINIFINSPGGVIMVADLIIAAMEVAQSKGVVINCASTVFAASAAFQILAHCDNRYVLETTLLLFHPARITVINRPLTTYGAKEISDTAAELDARLAPFLRKVMGMDRRVFEEAHIKEKWWNARQLQDATTGFITVVKRIDGIETFKLENNGKRTVRVAPARQERN